MNKRKLLIDCDPGHDDAIMLLISCYQKKYDIIGVTTCSGNQTVEKTSKNATNLLNYFGKSDIEISCGNPTPINRKPRICAEIHGNSGLDGFDFPTYKEKYVKQAACDFIIKKLLENDKVTVITSGPMTNLGMAIQKNRAILAHIDEICLMGGSTEEGNITKDAEFNILVDPEAADICFKSGVQIRMIGLNVTRQLLVYDSVVEEAKKINTKGSELFVKLMEVFNANQRKYFKIQAAPLHDPATIISLINKNVFKFKLMSVKIDTSKTEKAGKTTCVPSAYGNALVAVSANQKAFFKVIFKYLKKCK